jgi:vacuolar-type H+-ATPase subunit F/Vma7
MNTEKKSIQTFISKVANKDYAAAQVSLQNAIAEKIKSRVRNYISQEK